MEEGMNSAREKELLLIAQDLRIQGLEMVKGAHSGHIGGLFPYRKSWQFSISRK